MLLTIMLLLPAPLLAGPLQHFGIPDMHPVHSLHIGFSPRSASVLPDGQSQFEMSAAWSSTAVSTDDVVVDGESRAVFFRYRRGIAPEAEIYLELPVVWRGGGVLDPGVNSWHDLFGLPEGDRNDLEDNRYEVRLTDGGEGLQARGTELSNAILGLQYELLSSSRMTVSAFGEASLPTAAVDYGHNSIDLQAGLLGDLRLSERWKLSGGAAAAHLFDRSSSGFHFHEQYGAAFVSVSCSLTPAVALFVSALAHTPRVENAPTLDGSSIYGDFGIAAALPEERSLSLGIRENLAGRDRTTDFDLMLQISSPLSIP